MTLRNGGLPIAKRSPTPPELGASSQAAKRRPLHRDRVVQAAIAILDAEGPDALTFRRLAAELDVGVATLYWHVDSKEALLQLALDDVLGAMPSGFDADRPKAWEEPLRDGFVALRRVLRAHPWAAALAMASIERGPSLLRHWDRAATLLLDAGFDPRETFFGLSAIFTFVVGTGMQDAMWHSYGVDDDGPRASAIFAALDPAVHPSLPRLTPVIASHEEDQRFLAGLDLLIAGLRTRAPTRRGRRRRR